VVCTANIPSANDAEPIPGLPRSALDDHGWDALRAQCPASRIDRNVDLEVAERLLIDPHRYAQALADEPVRPFQAASINTAIR